MKKKYFYTDEALIEAVKISKSYVNIAKTLKVSDTSVRKYVKKYSMNNKHLAMQLPLQDSVDEFNSHIVHQDS